MYIQRSGVSLGKRGFLLVLVLLAGTFSGGVAAEVNRTVDIGKGTASRPLVPGPKHRAADTTNRPAAQAKAAPCKCTLAREGVPVMRQFAEIEVTLDEALPLARLASLPRAPGSHVQRLAGGKRARAQLAATVVGDLIESGADVKVLRDFMLTQKSNAAGAAVLKSVMAPALTCSGLLRMGTNGTNYSIPEGDWVYSEIGITGAPSNAVVTCIDVHYEIIHPYIGDLVVDLTDQDAEEDQEYRLWEQAGGAAQNINETVTGITHFAGEPVNQFWTLWAYDVQAPDTGYIDTWWIKVYYDPPGDGPVHDLCADAVTVQNGEPYAGTTAGASGDYESWCGDNDIYDVWHVYTPSQTGLVTVNVTSAGFDTTLAVFDQCGGVELACNDDACDPDDAENTNSKVTLRTIAGTDYYIRVAGYDGEIGNYTLTVTQQATALPDAAVLPSPADAASGVDTRVTLSWDGATPPAALRLKSKAADDVVQKVIYGADDRTEEYEVTNPDWLAAGQATVLIMYWSDLTDNGNGTYTMAQDTFAQWYEWSDPIGSGQPLCYDEPFRDQPSPGVCSGVLVAPDLIATAGHCASCEDAADLVVVFGFVMQDALTPTVTFSADEIYGCAEIVAYQDGYPDWSLLRLDRVVTDHTPVPLRRTGKVADGQDLLMVGHPWGIPRKYDGGGTVRDNTAPAFFQANLDAYVGNSGSPIFNRDTMVVEGFVSSGQLGFVEDTVLGCDWSKVCQDDTGCDGGWESMSRATAFSAAIPSFDVYLGTDPGSLTLVSDRGVTPWYDPGVLLADTTYYWKVVARNVRGEVDGPLWSFHTAAVSPYDPVYRFWSPTKSRHFYTISESEKAKLIDNYAHVWTFEGTAYYAFADDSEPDLMPIYRFWSVKSSSHFYTISEAEKTKLVDNYADVWTFEGPAFYAYPSGQQPAGASSVYRFWSDSKGTHFYTISESEKSKLIDNYSHVWTYEGLAWYAYR